MQNHSNQVISKTILVTGMPGSGKSYFSRHLAEKLGAIYLSTDRIRNEILDTKTYSRNEKMQVYRELKKRMMEALRQEQSVILDGTFYTSALRQEFMRTARKISEVFIIEVMAEESLIRERVSRDRSDSDADFTVYKKLKEEWEQIRIPHLTLQSTNDNLSNMLETAIQHINGQP